MKAFKAPEGGASDVAASVGAQGQALLKAHVAGYTRQDGTYVAEHDDKRVAAQPAKAPAHPHPMGKFAGKLHQLGTAAIQRAGETWNQEAQDGWKYKNAAEAMRAGDHAALKNQLSSADTAQRETITAHIHPDHWPGLGIEAIDHQCAVAKFHKQHGLAEPGAVAAPKKKALLPAKKPAFTVDPAAEADPLKEGAVHELVGKTAHHEKRLGLSAGALDPVKDGYSKTHVVRDAVDGSSHSVYSQDGKVRIRSHGKDDTHGVSRARLKKHMQSGLARPAQADPLATKKAGDAVRADVKAGGGAPSGAASQDFAPPQGDANEARWDDLPDEQNPRHALAGLSLATLSAAAKGRINLKHHAHDELASRGQDSDGRWIGFQEATRHHAKHTPAASLGGEHAKAKTEAAEAFQPLHTKILSAAAKGHLDLQAQAKHQLAARGHDANGKWVGFEAARAHHFPKAQPEQGRLFKALFVSARGASN